MTSLYETLTSKVIPRPYQKNLVDIIVEKPDNYLISLDKGLGKSYIPIWAFYKLQDAGKLPTYSKGLIIAHNTQLLTQWKDYLKTLGIPPEDVYINRSLSFWNSDIRGRQQSWDNRGIHQFKQQANLVNSMTRDVWNHAKWVISTPKTFASDALYMKWAEGGEGVLKQFKLAILDEVQNSVSIANSSDNSALYSHRVSRNFENLLSDFLYNEAYYPLRIGLSGGFDSEDRKKAVLEFFNIKPISVPKEELENWALDVRYHEVIINDSLVADICNGLNILRKDAIARLVKTYGIDGYGKSFYTDLAELLKKEEDDKKDFARQYAWFILSLDVMKLYLYDYPQFSWCYNQLVDVLDKVPRSMNNEDIVNNILSSGYQRLIKGELSGKTKALLDFVRVKDLSKLQIKQDNRGFLNSVMNDDMQAIIFCRTKKTVRDLTRLLQNEKIKADYVTGTGLSDEIKKERIKNFKDNKFNILVTIDKYLGEGMDFPNAKYTIDFSSTSNPGDWSQRVYRMRSGDFFSFLYEGTTEIDRLEHIHEELEKENISTPSELKEENVINVLRRMG
ncbi:ATP-dependent RNA helicase DbpA [Candidatus Tiddalikarchaeum anstoanum]|nr:ATP-dependent RNA helicase DbpA [Candidatus Tiddalikarchaeum anstoanum]